MLLKKKSGRLIFEGTRKTAPGKLPAKCYFEIALPTDVLIFGSIFFTVAIQWSRQFSSISFISLI